MDNDRGDQCRICGGEYMPNDPNAIMGSGRCGCCDAAYNEGVIDTETKFAHWFALGAPGVVVSTMNPWWGAVSDAITKRLRSRQAEAQAPAGLSLSGRDSLAGRVAEHRAAREAKYGPGRNDTHWPPIGSSIQAAVEHREKEGLQYEGLFQHPETTFVREDKLVKSPIKKPGFYACSDCFQQVCVCQEKKP